MNNLLIPFIITFLSGLSTAIGFLFIFFRPKNINNFIGLSLAFSGSIMFFISLFELIPNGFFNLLNEYNIIMASLILIFMIIIGDKIIIYFDKKIEKGSSSYSSLEKIGFLSMIGLMIHNMPEDCSCYVSH